MKEFEVEMSLERKEQNSEARKSKRPSERAARFILKIFGAIKDIYSSPSTVIPRGHVFHHQGREIPGGKAVRYGIILLVEDNPNTAQEFMDTITNYYVYGSVTICIAHAYDAAVTFFNNEIVNLVIMDADLDDEDGDGAALTGKFLNERPDLAILANSSSKISNLKLTGHGAVDTLGKNTQNLIKWLLKNDPTGSTGCFV